MLKYGVKLVDHYDRDSCESNYWFEGDDIDVPLLLIGD